MSTLKTGALRGTSGTADSIQLHASNQSVTFPGNVTFSGTVTGDNAGANITSVYKVTSDLTSVDQVTFGSLPSGIKKLWFVAESITHDSGNEPFRARIGDSGGLHTSGYASSAGYAGNPNTHGAADVAAWVLGYGSGGSGDTNSFYFEMAPVDSGGKKWVANWRLIQHAWSHVGFGGGFCALDTELTQIQFSNNSSSSDFATGSMALHYIK